MPCADAAGKAGLKCNLGLMLFRTCVRCPLPGGGYIYRKKWRQKKKKKKKSRTQTVKKARMCKRYERLSILKIDKTETSVVQVRVPSVKVS